MENLEKVLKIILKHAGSKHGDVNVPYEAIPAGLEDNFDNYLDTLVRMGKIQFYKSLVGMGYMITI